MLVVKCQSVGVLAQRKWWKEITKRMVRGLSPVSYPLRHQALYLIELHISSVTQAEQQLSTSSSFWLDLTPTARSSGYLILAKSSLARAGYQQEGSAPTWRYVSMHSGLPLKAVGRGMNDTWNEVRHVKLRVCVVLWLV
jgi:hypothetical protein